MKGKLGLLAMAAALMSGGYEPNAINNGNPLLPEDIDTTPKMPPIPKGCKRYFYNKEGVCNEGRHEVYFDCMKPRNAATKFENWKLKNQTT